MATQAAVKSGFDKWMDGITAAPGDARWHIWDCEIQAAVNEFNRYLAGTAGYRPLDWQIVKTMVWVESGAGDPQWHIKPMQIGVVGDAGMDALLSGNEGGDLILPPVWRERLTVLSVRTVLSHNIRAGIGYLLMKMATYEYRSIPATDTHVYETTVQPGDSLERLAKRHGSTTDVMRKLNPEAKILRPGQVLKFQKATVQRVITGWRPISHALISERYNGGRDRYYIRRLDFALNAVRTGRTEACAP